MSADARVTAALKSACLAEQHVCGSLPDSEGVLFCDLPPAHDGPHLDRDSRTFWLPMIPGDERTPGDFPH